MPKFKIKLLALKNYGVDYVYTFSFQNETL